MKLITEFENYVLKEYPISELDKTISEDGHVVSYILNFRGNEHQFINLRQIDNNYIRFEFYYKKIGVHSDYLFENETPEEQMTTLKGLFDYTLDAYKKSINYIY